MTSTPLRPDPWSIGLYVGPDPLHLGPPPGVTNPVMVQGAVFAGITITEGWSRDPYTWIRTGDIVRVDPVKKTLQLIESRQPPL